MGDFNDRHPTGWAGSGPARIDLAEIKDALNADPASALAYILPSGYVHKREFRCGDVFNTPPSPKGGSFSFNLDKLTGDDFGDLNRVRGNCGVYDVYVDHCRGDQRKAIELARAYLGMPEAERPQVRQDKSGRKSKPIEWFEIEPLADEMPNFKALWKGSFKQAWPYRDQDGRLLFYVARYESGSKKDTPAITYGHTGDGVLHWRAKGGKAIIFGQELLNNPGEVWVFEGEKTATAARALFPDRICLAWKGGDKNIRNVNLTPLAGRRVRFVADADHNGVGQKAMAIGADRALQAGVQAVAVAVMPNSFPDGWDVADALPKDWTVGRIRALIEAAEWKGQPTPTPPRGTKEGVAPYHRTDPRPVSEVRPMLESTTRQSGNIAIRTTPGSGKTTAEIKLAMAEKGWIIFAEPNHQIALQVVKDMDGFGFHLAGRNYDAMCEIPEDAEDAHGAGLNVREELCNFCPHKGGCRYLAQLDRIKQAMDTRPSGAVVTVHPYYAQSMAREIDSDRITRIVIDEKIDLDRDTRIPLDRLDKDCSDVILGRQIMDSFDEDGFLPLSGLDADDIENRAEIEGRHVRLKLDPNMDFEARRLAIREHAAKRKGDFRWRFQLLFRTMADEIRDGRNISNQVVLVRNEKVGKAEPRDYIHIYGKKQVAEKLAGVDIHYVDGTMDRLHAEALLGSGCSYVALDAARNLIVTQVCDAVFSKNHLLFCPDAESNRKRIYRFVAALGQHHRKILIGVPKKARDVMEDEWTLYAGTMENPPTVSWIHHNVGRGENRFSDYDCAIVIGREEPSVRTIEALARMRFPETPIIPIPASDSDGENGPTWPKRFQGYVMKDGRQIGVELPYHPCPLCQSVLTQIREGEIVQIVDRLRGVNRVDAPAVYILTNVPTEIGIDRLVCWRDLLAQTCGDQWWQEAVRIGGGVAPLSPAWLVNAGLFESESAAKSATYRLSGIMLHQTNDINISLLQHYPNLVTYRLLGQRGKDSLALVANGVQNASEILARHVGPLSKFDGAAVPDSPMENVQMPADDLIQFEPGALEPDFDKIPEPETVAEPVVAGVDEEVVAAAPIGVPAALVNAKPIILLGQEIGRELTPYQFVPATTYWCYDEFERFRPAATSVDPLAGAQAIKACLLRIGEYNAAKAQRAMKSVPWAKEDEEYKHGQHEMSDRHGEHRAEMIE